MPSVLRAVATFALLASFTGCAPTKAVTSPVEPNTALVYAYVDLGKSPSSWQQATILCRDRNGKEGWWRAMRIDGSLFYAENVPLGTCWMPAAVAVVALRGSYHYDLGKTAEANPTTTRITRPGAVFMGAYRFEPKGSDSFRLTPVKSPSEKAVLNELRAHTDGTPWDRVVAERLRRL
jgi:hypothetical protein